MKKITFLLFAAVMTAVLLISCAGLVEWAEADQAREAAQRDEARTNVRFGYATPATAAATYDLRDGRMFTITSPQDIAHFRNEGFTHVQLRIGFVHEMVRNSHQDVSIIKGTQQTDPRWLSAHRFAHNPASGHYQHTIFVPINDFVNRFSVYFHPAPANIPNDNRTMTNLTVGVEFVRR